MVRHKFNIDVVVDRATVISELTEKFSMEMAQIVDNFHLKFIHNFDNFNASPALMRTHATMFPAIGQGPKFL